MASWSDIYHPSTWGADLKEGEKSLTGGIRSVTNDLGITNPAPPDLSKGPDADALRKFAGQLSDQYQNFAPAAAGHVVATPQDQAQSYQARQVQQQTIGGLQGVVGGDNTAADSLLRKGLDEGARSAMGTAAAYSAANPGLALRAGLTAGNDVYNKGAADAGILKANEIAAARGQLVDAANAMRAGDVGIAKSDQDATNAAATTNQTADLTQQDINNRYKSGLASTTANTLLGPLAASQANAQIQAQNNAANSTAVGGLISASGKAIAASDPELKTGIRDGTPEADQFLASLTPRSYEWKDPVAHRPGEQLGVVTSEMPEKDVVKGPDGKNWISADVIGKVLAGMGRLHDRVAAVEGGAQSPKDVQWGPNPYPPPEPKRPPTTGERRRG